MKYDSKFISLRSLITLLWVLVIILITQIHSYAGEYDRFVVGTVIKVRDGDTISVRVANTDEILEFRLYGINAIESNKPYYYEATKYLANQILGKYVDLYITGKGKFPSLLLTRSQKGGSQDNCYIAKVNHSDKYSNLMLVSSGLATHYKHIMDVSPTCSPVCKHEVYGKDLALAKAEARMCHIGIWK